MTSVTAQNPIRASFKAGAVQPLAHLAVTAISALLWSCGQRSATAEPPPPLASEPSSSTFKVQPQPSPNNPSGVLEEEDGELRRGYGVVDMRYEPCVKPDGVQTLRGEGCPTGFVIYGPYVNVPAKSEIEVTFEMQPSQKVEVYGDIVAQMGKQVLAGLNPQALEAGVTHKLGYRVNVFNADHFVESRIGLRSTTPAQFVIKNYTMTVR